MQEWLVAYCILGSMQEWLVVYIILGSIQEWLVAYILGSMQDDFIDVKLHKQDATEGNKDLQC